MIRLAPGDALNATGIIVHGCNAQGVMGSGIAKAVKARFPGAYAVYREAYEQGVLTLGSATIWRQDSKTIVNGVTQEFYGRDGKRYVDYDAVRKVFEGVARIQQTIGGSVNFPLIGCGLGGGDWKVVSKIIEETQSPETELVLWIPR